MEKQVETAVLKETIEKREKQMLLLA